MSRAPLKRHSQDCTNARLQNDAVLIMSCPSYSLFRKLCIIALGSGQFYYFFFFFFLLERRRQQDNATFNSLIATSSLAICMTEMEGRERRGGRGREGEWRRQWCEDTKQFVGKAEMDSESTPGKRWNRVLREGRCNNEPKDRGKDQREERDGGAEWNSKSPVQQQRPLPNPPPFTDLSHIDHLYSVRDRQWT